MQVAGCGMGAAGCRMRGFGAVFSAKNLGLVNTAKWRCYTRECTLYAR